MDNSPKFSTSTTDVNDSCNMTFGSFAESSLMETSVATVDIGDHFIDLLKYSNMPESLLPDPDFIRRFFAENEGGEEFASFLMTLGPQNFVTEDQVARFQKNVSQGVTDEDVDKYLAEKLGDQNNLVPMTSETIDRLEAKLKKTEEEFRLLEEVNSQLKLEVKKQNSKWKNLNEATVNTDKSNEDKLKIIKTTAEAISKKKSETGLLMSSDDFPVKEEVEAVAQIDRIIKEIVSALAEGMKKQTDSIKVLSILISRCTENTDNIRLISFKERQHNTIEKITNDLMIQIIKLNVVNKFISALHQSRLLLHMPVILENLNQTLDEANKKVKDILSIKPDVEIADFDDNIKKLNLILNDSPSSNAERLLEPLEKIVKVDEEPLKDGIEKLTPKLIHLIHTIENTFTYPYVDSMLLNELVKNKEICEANLKLFEESANSQQDRNLHKELLQLMIADPQLFLSKLDEIEEKVKLFEKAVI